MGLFRSVRNLANSTASLQQSIATQKGIKNMRQQIFDIRDRLKGTPQFAEIFSSIVNDIHHPPCHIVANQSGCFWTEAWQGTSYEPFSTAKYNNPDIAYLEGCAIFLLIQEMYPNVYTFPSNSAADIADGVQIELIMDKKQYGKGLNPTFDPRRAAPAAPAPAAPAPAPVNPAPAGAVEAGFCPKCGKPHAAGVKFCGYCGHRFG